MIALLAAAALGQELGNDQIDASASLSSPIEAMAIGTFGLTAVVVAATGSGIDAVPVTDAWDEVLAHSELRARALVLRDQDGDGQQDVILCGDDGLLWLPWTSAGFGAAQVVDPSPCIALVEHNLDGLGGLVSAGEDLVRWDDAGDGTFLGPTDLGVALSGIPLLATGDARVAVATVGESTVTEIAGGVTRTLTAAGSIAGLAWGGSGWWASLSAPAAFQALGSDPLALDETPGMLVAGDLDGDGRYDAVVAGEVYSQVVWGGIERELAVATGPGPLAVGELDDDGCFELAFASAEYVFAVSASHCLVGGDADRDGYLSPEDCDNTDPAVFPGAEEDCDGVDNDCDGVVDDLYVIDVCNAIDDDCDGVIDETEVGIVGPTTVDEGDVTSFMAAVGGCDEISDLTWAWTWSGDGLADCVTGLAQASCSFTEDGAATLSVTGFDDTATAFGTATVTVPVLNVAPTVRIPDDPDADDLSDGDLSLEVDEHWATTLTADDPGIYDTSTFTSTDLPSFVELSSDGYLDIYAGEAGIWYFGITVTDDDGGTSTTELVLGVGQGEDWNSVEPEDADSGYDTSDVDQGEEPSSYGEGCGSSNSDDDYDDDDDDDDDDDGCSTDALLLSCADNLCCCSSGWGSPAALFLLTALIARRRRP